MIKNIIQILFIGSFFLFYWQFDKDWYVPEETYNYVSFALTLILGVLNIVIEFKLDKKEKNKLLKALLNIALAPILIIVLSKEMVVNVYTIIIYTLLVFLSLIPLFQFLFGKK